MATVKPRFSLTIPDDLLAQVEEYQARQKLSTKSKAIQKLVEIGIRESTDDPHTTRYAARSRVEERYYALDETGRKLVDAVMTIEGERFAAPVVLPQARPTKVIPLFVAAAGPGEPVPDEPFNEYEVDQESKAQFAVKISGDSMEPELHDGEIVLCERKRPEIGELAVMMVNGFLLCKQYIDDSFGNMYLRSINRKRKALDVDIMATGNDTVTAYGRVIGHRPPLVRE